MASSTAVRPVDKPHYRYWQALYSSFFSPKLYVDVAKRWRGLAFGYLFVLSALLSLPVWLRTAIDFNHFFEDQIRAPMREMPTLYVQKGIVSIDKVVPYLITDKFGDVQMIIDTSGHINEIDSRRYPKLWALVTKDKLIYRMPMMPVYFAKHAVPQTSTTVQTIPFDKEINQVFDGRSWEKVSHLNRLQWETQMMLYPTLWFTFFAMYSMFILVFAMMLQLFSQVIFKIMLTYKQVCRLLVLASTMPLTVFFVLLATDTVFQYSGWMLLVFLMLYYIFGILSVRAESYRVVRY